MRNLAAIAALVMLSGCAIGPIGDIAETIPSKVTFSCTKDPVAQARSASLVTPGGFGIVSGRPVALPDELAKDKVANALLAAMTELSRPTLNARSGDIYTYTEMTAVRLPDLSPGDFRNFMDAFATSTLAGTRHMDNNAGPNLRSASDDKLSSQALFREYYRAYLKGEFITRFGVKLAKPEIGWTVGNEALAGTLMVFLEAVNDLAFQTPILKTTGDNGKAVYYPGQTDKKPTALAVKGAVVPEEVVQAKTDVCGITKSEAEAISWLANLAEDKSAMVSGLILESLQGVELSFVIGGHLAVGDNQTLAVLVKGFTGTASKYMAEYAAYRFFWHFAYTTDVSTRSASAVMLTSSPPLRHVDAMVHARSGSAEDQRLAQVAKFIENFND